MSNDKDIGEEKKLKDEKKRISRLNSVISKVVSGFKPPENITVSEWADKKRRLSPESSAEVGAWRTSRTPYLKEPMDSFSDPKVHRIVISASSQVGKSEVLNNCIGDIIDQDPGSILFVHPTTIDAKDYSRLRIAPMIRDCKSLKEKVADPKSRDSANTILQKTYPGGILTMCGSTEAHALASKPMRYLVGDECDRWATSAGTEGDPWGLACARQITFYNYKSIRVSTPTIKGKSAIEKAYAEGTMERWKSQCPHCGEYHEIVFDDIRFDYDEIEIGNYKSYKVTAVYYACPGCGGVSSEHEMKKAPARWEAQNPEALEHGIRSFWLTSWVSPWASWESTILLFLQAKGDTKKLQVVYNTRFGQLWEDRGDLEDEEGVMARREEYDAELPDGVLCLTCGVDTQDDRLEYEIVGYGRFRENWGIKKGVILGKPDGDEVWSELDKVVDKIYYFKSGKGLKISLTFIDEGGHYTQDVRTRCRERLHKHVFAIKGRGGDDIPYTSPPKKQKIVVNGKILGMCWVYELGVNAGKQMILDGLRVQQPGARYSHFPKRDDYGTAYFKGLLSERVVYKEGQKHPFQWEKIPGHERNEVFDIRNYANAAEKVLQPDYDAIEARLRGTQPTPKTAVATHNSSVNTATKRKRNTAKDKYDDW